MRWPLLQVFVLAALCLCGSAAAADAASEETLEDQVRAQVNQALTRSRPRLVVQDTRLEAVASWMASAALDQRKQRSAIRQRLWQEGVRDFEFCPAVVVGPGEEVLAGLEEVLEDRNVDWSRFNAVGLSVQASGDRTAIALLLTRRSATFVGTQDPRDRIVLRGGYSKPRLFVTNPSGGVERREAHEESGIWTLNLSTEGEGSWLFELMAEGQRGPEVLALWPVRGTAALRRGLFQTRPPAPTVPSTTPDDAAAWVRGGAPGPDRSPTSEDVTAAEDRLWDLIQEARTARGLSTLERLDGIRQAARQQAGDLGRGEAFGHHTSSGTALDRLGQADVLVSRVVENVALAADVSMAHAALMASPAHRANLLDPDVEAAGVGVVLRRDSAGRWSAAVSEVLVELLPDVEAREAILFEHINEARRRGGLLELKLSRVLSNEARKAASWVVDSAGLTLPDGARNSLTRAVRFHYVSVGRIGVDLIVTNDLSAVTDLHHVGGRTYDEVGIGAAVLRQRMGVHAPGTLVAVLVFIER
ncbi:MAG: CAP domain-containing protein [Myxococcota bacterium]|nr:CAP domain-containing protein [Myxococcota bacterium]